MISIRNVALAILVFFSSFAWSDNGGLVVEITKGIDDPTSVAVVPFGWNGRYRLNEDVAQIVQNDLVRTGEFKAVGRNSMLSMPSTVAEVFPRDWRMLKTQYLVVGQMVAQGTLVKLNYALVDVVSGKTLLSGDIEKPRTLLRDMAHEAADDIYKKLTGFPGVFTTKIAYIRSNRDAAGKDTYRLIVADQDGHRERDLLKSSEPIMSPSWSPTGRYLAYVSFEKGRPAIYAQEIATGKRQKLTSFEGLNSSPQWSPDGSKLAMVLSKDGDPEIYTLDVRSGRVTRLTHHFAIDTEPSWLPDGKSLVFTSNRGGTPQIYKISLASGQVKRLTFNGNYNARGRVSLDGKYLIMVHRGSRIFQIAAQNLKTGRVHVLTNTTLDESPTISPNGRMVMYATKDGDKGILSAVAIDGGIRVKLPATVGNVREPAWSPFTK